MDAKLREQLPRALQTAVRDLLAERNTRGFWAGELSSSALSTATAVTALALAARHGMAGRSSEEVCNGAIDAGLKWLANHANTDGGWGDTTKSLSNISTTTLGWAAFGAANADEQFPSVISAAERWLANAIGVAAPQFRRSPSMLARAIIARYGKDRTFSVPILTMCALAGRLGSGRAAWNEIIPLPFELAACPHQLFAALRLPVVSYALPALIGIGQAHHVHAPSRYPWTRWLRDFTRERTLRVLTRIQPENGGFLEATPLTSFVTMSLAASGRVDHVVTRRGLEFLLQSRRSDGSWPIDTNLATWCTTLAIEALPATEVRDLEPALRWLLGQQHGTEHPYTHAAPGGWAWTDLPGGVPDADDTSGALIALAKLRSTEAGACHAEIRRAVEAGVRWLLDLQNRDGGIPTFCRGWGTLPFDRSSADITAHAMRAWQLWRDELSSPLLLRTENALRSGLRFLMRGQRPDGAWAPLWFGNQFAASEENLTYGTARVVRALSALTFLDAEKALERGIIWLTEAQHPEGSWGGIASGPPSIEETALATEALACAARRNPSAKIRGAVTRGANWLLERVATDEWKEPSPIGFYFAKLWYWERHYPMIFTVGALRACAELATRE